MIVTPALAGRQLVRFSLPLPRGMVPDGHGLVVADSRQKIGAAIRPLTWYPQEGRESRCVRRGLLTFVYDFADTDPVAFQLQPATGTVAATDFPVTVEVDEAQAYVRYADGTVLAAELLAPERTATTAPRVETVEDNACYRWQRFHLSDAQWPRVVEVRSDVLGGVVLVAHLQRLLPENGYTPDLGWRVACPDGPARLRVGGEAVDVGQQAAGHDFSHGVPCALLLAGGQLRLEHPAAALKRQGRVDTQLEDGRPQYRYWRCRAADQVPMQPAAWRRVELSVAPDATAPLRPTLETAHQVQVDGGWWDELYQTGPPLDLGATPELAALVDYHHEAVVRSAVQGDDWGNVTSYADARECGAVQGMNRLNHCAPIFMEGYRSGDRRLLETAVLWCDNFYDHTIWWGEGHPGGTRYPNSSDVWRSNTSVNFCTKGYDSFFIAYEQTGDPRMLEALEAQVEYAGQHLHADRGECRNIGDARDFVRLYRYTGQPRYLEQALRLFGELRGRLSTGDLFDQGGKPLEHDLPFVQDDRKGLLKGYAKPYIVGYALVGLPELLELAPEEPKLADTVRAVADFLARSQDPLGGWRYPHPRSGSVNLNQAIEHAWQLVQADLVLGAGPEHLDAIERVLRQRFWGWQRTGQVFASLGGWETATGALAQGQTLEDLYWHPEERDFHRDYAEGNPTLGSSSPEGLVYFSEVLAFYLRHRPASRLLATPSGDPLAQVLARVPPGQEPMVKPPRYPVTVDYSLTLEEMIAAGSYGRVRDEIDTAHYPVDGEGTMEAVIELLCFDRSMHSSEALTELGRLGYRPASLVELLALGAAYPQLEAGIIVALGSSWEAPDGRRYVVYHDTHLNHLNLFTRDCGWVLDSRFAGIRER